MADANRTPQEPPNPLPTGAIPGVEVSERDWGISYRGTKDALLVAGVLYEEWMPRVPPGKKKPVGITRLPGGRVVRVHRAGVKAKALTVRHYYADEERAQRQPKFDAERLAERAHEETEKEIAKWPTSKADFARKLERNGCWVLQTVYDCAKDGLGGYRVAPESMIEITEAFQSLVEALRDAKVAFYPKERQLAEAKLRGRAASHDAAFGAFLGRVMTTDGEAAGGAA